MSGGFFEESDRTEETEIARYHNNAAFLLLEGRRQFLLPGCTGGAFCVLCGIALFPFDAWRLASAVLLPLGAALIAAATLLYAIFHRESVRAGGCGLRLTDRRVIFCGGGAERALPLSSVLSVRVEKDTRFHRVPFDMTALERTFLVLETEKGEERLPYLSDAGGACERIEALLSAR